MPRAGRLAAPEASAKRKSKLCGSRVTVDVALDDDRVAELAQDVRACASVRPRPRCWEEHVIGARVSELELARDQLSRYAEV